jgi:hypothetical protein
MHTPALHEVPKYFIQEGNRIVTLRPDGSVDETNLKQASAEMFLKGEEIPSLDPQARFAKLDDMAKEMAKQMSEHLFAEINQAVERVGNVVDRKGKPLDPEAYFEVLEKIWLEFNEDGTPQTLTLVIPPEMQERARQTLELIQTEPALKKRYEELIIHKRIEWRAREAARKLVG